jgi:hypothetical protein
VQLLGQDLVDSPIFACHGQDHSYRLLFSAPHTPIRHDGLYRLELRGFRGAFPDVDVGLSQGRWHGVSHGNGGPGRTFVRCDEEERKSMKRLEEKCKAIRQRALCWLLCCFGMCSIVSCLPRRCSWRSQPGPSPANPTLELAWK